MSEAVGMFPHTYWHCTQVVQQGSIALALITLMIAMAGISV